MPLLLFHVSANSTKTVPLKLLCSIQNTISAAMQFYKNHWLFSGGAVIGIAICLILTSITSNIENDPSSNAREKKRAKKSNLLRDHWNLARLFNIIHLNCGLLSGEMNSNETIDKLWNLTDQVSSSKLVSMDLRKLSRELDQLSKTINSTHYHPLTVDFKSIIALLRSISKGRSVDLDKLRKDSEEQGDKIVKGMAEREHVQSGKDWDVYETRAIQTITDLYLFQEKISEEEIRKIYLNTDADDMKLVMELRETILRIQSDIVKTQLASSDTRILFLNETLLNTVSKQLESTNDQAVRLRDYISNVMHSIDVRKTLESLAAIISSLDSSTENSSRFPTNLFTKKSETFFAKLFHNPINLESLKAGTNSIQQYSELLSMLENNWKKGKNGPLAMLDDVIGSFKAEEKLMSERIRFMKSVDINLCFKHIRNEIRNYLNTEGLKASYVVWQGFVEQYETDLTFLNNTIKMIYVDEYEKIKKEIEEVKWLALIGKDITERPRRIKEIREKPEFQKAISSVQAMQKISSFFVNNPLTYSEEHKKARKEVTEAQLSIIEKVKSLPDNCNEESFKYKGIEHFLQFHKYVGQFKKENTMQRLDKELVRPLRRAQIQIRSLSDVAHGMRTFPMSYNIYCNELCQRMKGARDFLTNFPHGVEYLEKLWNIVEHKSTIKKLPSYTVVVRKAAENSKTRSGENYLIEDYFKWVAGNMSRIEKAFGEVQNLETMHNKGEWKNLTSLTKIYEAAGKIKSPIDFKRMHELMEELIQETNLKDPKLLEALAITKNLSEIMTDLSLRHVALQKSIESLKNLDQYFDGFFEWSQPKPTSQWNTILGYLIIILISGALLMGTVAFLGWMMRDRTRKRSMTPEDRVNDPDFILTNENRPFWPQLLQCARLPINQRDSDGYTKLFCYFENGDIKEAENLIKQGIAIDAACGPKCQTALQEAVVRGDRKMVDLLLKYGADRKCLDLDGKSAKRLCSRKDYTEGVFAKNYDNRYNQILPKVKRDFYVLIVERAKFPEEYLERLPPSLEIVYGYREGEVDLADFTHFAIFPRATGSKDLDLDLNNMLAFEMVSKPGMIVSAEWLVACMENADEVDMDWKYLLTDITFEKKTHLNVLTKIKNDIHRLRPPLFHQMQITILPTANRIMDTDRDIWIRIIQNFGGKHTVHPYPSDPQSIPYHFQNELPPIRLNQSVVLYFKDSVLLERWTWPENFISLIGMGWLPESIVRYQLIRPDDHCLRNEENLERLAVIYEQGCIKDKGGDGT